MKKIVDSLIHQLKASSLSKEELLPLLEDLEKIRKEDNRKNFTIRRTLKDKEIAVNLLNQTISDLQENELKMVQANELLSAQKKEIEAINLLLKEQSEELAGNLQHLQIAYQDLEQFSYIASHDLRSPLRNIISFGQILLRKHHDQLDKNGQEFLSFIISSSTQMNEILQDLSQYSGISRMESEIIEIDLNEIVEIVEFNLQEEINETEASIQTDNLPSVMAVKSGLVQLIQNLVANAIKFRSELAPVIHLGCTRDDEEWHFTLSDNGIGMKEVYHEKVFKPFQRLNNIDFPGTGMGLAICRKILALHNGKIWYQSREGEGTSFHFTLPVVGNLLTAPSELLKTE